MTGNWAIIEASAPDFEALSVIHGQCFVRRWSAAELRSLTTDGVAMPLMAMKDNTIAGFVLPRVVAGEAEILTIAVAPAHQRTGAGAALLNEAIAWAATMGAETVFLEVDEENAAALTLYRCSGFKPAGRRPGYFEASASGSSPAKSALVMRLEIGK